MNLFRTQPPAVVMDKTDEDNDVPNTNDDSETTVHANPIKQDSDDDDDDNKSTSNENDETRPTIPNPLVVSKLLVSSNESLLPIHPNLINKSSVVCNTITKDIIPYFAAFDHTTNHNNDNHNNSSGKVIDFWVEAHTLSCQRRLKLWCTSNQVQSDFTTIKDGLQSMCVNDALSLDVFTQTASGERNQAHLLIKLSRHNEDVDGKNSVSSLLFSPLSHKVDGSSGVSWETAADYIGNAYWKDTQSSINTISTTNDTTTTTTTTTGATKAVVSATTYVAKSVASGVGWGLTSLLARLDLADDPDDHHHHDHIGNSGIDEDPSILETSSSSRKNVMLNDQDSILSVNLTFQCMKAILHHAQTHLLSNNNNNDKEDPTHPGGGEMIVLYRQGISKLSFCNFVHQVAQSLSTTTTMTQEDATTTMTHRHDISTTPILLPQLLSNLASNDIQFLAHALIAANYAQPSQDGTLIALFPHGILTTTKSYMSQTQVAIFTLTTTRSSIETRRSSLLLSANKCKTNAIQSSHTNHKKMAISHMKRRALLLTEIDRCSDTLLNLDTSIEAVYRAMNDVDVIKSMESCRDAMRFIRSSNENVVEEVDDLMMDIKEEMDLVSDVGNALSGGGTMEDEELNLELDQLEQEMMGQDVISPVDGRIEHEEVVEVKKKEGIVGVVIQSDENKDEACSNHKHDTKDDDDEEEDEDDVFVDAVDDEQPHPSDLEKNDVVVNNESTDITNKKKVAHMLCT